MVYDGNSLFYGNINEQRRVFVVLGVDQASPLDYDAVKIEVKVRGYNAIRTYYCVALFFRNIHSTLLESCTNYPHDGSNGFIRTHRLYQRVSALRITPKTTTEPRRGYTVV